MDKLKRDLELEALIGQKQWGGDYWGPEGAIALMQRYLDSFDCTEIATMIFVRMTHTSLHYSASGSAKARVVKILKQKQGLKFWQLPMWSWRAYFMLGEAWDGVLWAEHMINLQNPSLASIGAKFSAQDFDAMQSVTRKWYCLQRWISLFIFNKRKLGKMIDLAGSFIRQGLADDECSDITKCLLLIGQADVLLLESDRHTKVQARVEAFNALWDVWEIAVKIASAEPNDQMVKQLARVFGNLVTMNEKLIPFDYDLPGQDHRRAPANATELHELAKPMMNEYLQKSNSLDQQMKAPARSALPA